MRIFRKILIRSSFTYAGRLIGDELRIERFQKDVFGDIISYENGLSFFQMPVENPGEFQHVDGSLAAKNFGELGIGDNQTLVIGVLQLVRFNVFPNLFGHFGPGEFFFAQKRG